MRFTKQTALSTGLALKSDSSLSSHPSLEALREEAWVEAKGRGLDFEWCRPL